MMVVVCPVDGDLWRQPGAKPGDVMEAALAEPCQEWVPPAKNGDAIVCPRCGRSRASGLREEQRPDE